MPGHWEHDEHGSWWVNADGQSPMPKNERAANMRPGNGPYAGMGIPKGERLRQAEAERAAREEKIRKENEENRRYKEWEDAQPKSYHYRKAAEEHEEAAGFWSWVGGFVSGRQSEDAKREAERNRQYAQNARKVADEDERQRQAAYERTPEGRAHASQEQGKRTQLSEAEKTFANWVATNLGKSDEQLKKEYKNFIKEYHPDRQRKDRREFAEEMMKQVHNFYSLRGLKP